MKTNHAQPHTLREVTLSGRVRQSRRVAQGSGYEDSVSDIPYRLISIFPSVAFARLGITPNQVTIAWIILGFIGIALFCWRGYAVGVTGACLLQTSYLLDFVDGEVARLQMRTSRLGVFLDLAGHVLIKTAMFLALGYRLLVSTGRVEYLLLGFCACVGISNGHVLSLCAAQASIHRSEASSQVGKNRPVLQIRSLAGLLFESPGIYAVVFMGALLNRLTWAVIFYGVFGPVWYLYRGANYCLEQRASIDDTSLTSRSCPRYKA